eukprot:6004918-Pleurochrysis_carterae.AAC.1
MEGRGNAFRQECGNKLGDVVFLSQEYRISVASDVDVEQVGHGPFVLNVPALCKCCSEVGV